MVLFRCFSWLWLGFVELCDLLVDENLLLGSVFGFLSKERGPRRRRGPLSFDKKYVVNLKPTQMRSRFCKGD